MRIGGPTYRDGNLTQIRPNSLKRYGMKMLKHCEKGGFYLLASFISTWSK